MSTHQIYKKLLIIKNLNKNILFLNKHKHKLYFKTNAIFKSTFFINRFYNI